MKTVEWVDEYLHREFSSEGYMGKDGEQWLDKSRSWVCKYLMSLGATKIRFHRGHYEWSAFAQFGDKWVYLSSGDCRFKVTKTLLVRTARSETDYTGGHNNFVSYDSPDFPGNLQKMIVMLISEANP